MNDDQSDVVSDIFDNQSECSEMSGGTFSSGPALRRSSRKSISVKTESDKGSDGVESVQSHHSLRRSTRKSMKSDTNLDASEHVKSASKSTSKRKASKTEPGSDIKSSKRKREVLREDGVQKDIKTRRSLSFQNNKNLTPAKHNVRKEKGQFTKLKQSGAVEKETLRDNERRVGVKGSYTKAKEWSADNLRVTPINHTKKKSSRIAEYAVCPKDRKAR